MREGELNVHNLPLAIVLRSCLSPDASWIPLERWTDLRTKEQTGFSPLCPEFLIEVRSKSEPRSRLWSANS